MTYDVWIAQVKLILAQEQEGAITSREAFNAVIHQAFDVEQTNEDEFTPRPSPLESTPDAAAEWAIDARMAEAALRDRR